MKCYADSSVIVSLLAPDSRTDAAKALYLKLKRPRLPYTPLHELEVGNAIRLRTFLSTISGDKSARSKAEAEQKTAVSRVKSMLQRQMLLSASLNWEALIEESVTLSTKHTTRIGCRALDIQQVAAAVTLNSDTFITADLRQGALAKAAGLKVFVLE